MSFSVSFAMRGFSPSRALPSINSQPIRLLGVQEPEKPILREGLSMTHTWLAGVDEAPAVAQLLCEFRDWWASSEPRDDDLLASVRHIMAGTDGEYLLAGMDDDEPAGVAQLRYRWSVWKTAADCWLEDLYVREAARRSGLGTGLVQAAVERARSRGCRR